jgi:SAM-dependent methyltransferase
LTVSELYAFFWVLWFIAIILILAYGFVLLFGAPYFPSLKPHVSAALDLLDLKKGQVVYDLGCGDGRFLRSAAKAGYKAVGYELNPIMFMVSWISTRRYGRRVKVRMRNFWHTDISKADAVYVFLLDKYMPKLDQKLANEGKKGLKLASHTFKIPGKKPAAEKYGIYLYRY